MFDELYKLVSSNQFASAGLLTVATGAILSYCRSIPSKMYSLFLEHMTTEIDLREGSVGYYWMVDWFGGGQAKKYGKYEISVKNEKINYTIAHGRYWRWYKCRLMIINKYRRKSGDTSEEEWISVRFLASKKIVEDFFNNIRQKYDSQEFNKVNVNINNGGYWRYISSRPTTIPNPILEGDTFETIINDAKKFFENEKEYNERGLLYKRGYVLSGPPGNGKTTTIAAIAARLQKHICHLSLANITNQQFLELITGIGNMSILVLEDVDCIQSTHNRKDKNGVKNTTPPLDMSTILNVLDGNLTPHGLLFIMTTNHKDKLDPALLRPGRTDVHIEINGPNENKIRRLYERLTGSLDGVDEFLKQEFSSMADVQNKIFEMKGNYVVST